MSQVITESALRGLDLTRDKATADVSIPEWYQSIPLLPQSSVQGISLRSVSYLLPGQGAISNVLFLLEPPAPVL